MKTIVNSGQMQFCDANTINYFKVPSMVLMERAALAVFEQIRTIAANQSRRVLLVCGNGNNGADGLAVARLLYLDGFEVTTVQVHANDENCRRSKENQNQREILHAYQVVLYDAIPDADYDVVVDALFGIGLSRGPEGIYADFICRMNQISAYKIAIDMPSGVSADDGSLYPGYFQADLTVTFAYEKLGQVLYPGCEACGKVIAAQIGITDEGWLERKPDCFILDDSDMVHLPKRPAYSNKGTFGKVLAVAGCKGMSGAAYFCAKAAYRMGCGLVKLYTEESNRIILQQQLPEALIETYGDAIDVQALKEALEWADVVLLGPGLGRSALSRQVAAQVLEHSRAPLVIDADGLNAVAQMHSSFHKLKSPVVITPHLGEMARLVGSSIAQIQKKLIETAEGFAKQEHVVCVLKDAHTVIACPDGRKYINISGNNALAKGGSGDLLAGIIAALLARKLEPGLAAALGAYLHGKAGSVAGRQLSNYGALATDILNTIPAVLADYENVGGTNRGKL